uniref:RING-type E3 ubiquitin transferase n=1 Tax=Aegilops tauschii TaxID=37682 RepID=R7W5J2_AEGTA
MAPPRNHPGLFLCFLLLASTATLSAAVSAASYSSVCTKPGPADDRYTDGNETLLLTSFFQISTGYFSFSEGAHSLFSAAADDDPYGSECSDKDLVHLTATLTLTGPRVHTYRGRGRRENYTGSASVSFILDGFYSSASLELCMVGKGTEHSVDGSPKHYPDVVLRLRVPDRPSLTDPFVTGSLEVSDFGAIQLLAYAEGDNYKYASEGAACSAPTPTQPARDSYQALGSGFAWCAHLKQQLVTAYRLEHGGEPLLRRMHVNQMQCTAKGAVRAYVVFSNDTGSTERHRFFNHRPHRFSVDEEAVVAEGRWDKVRGSLCLRACPVVRSASAPSVPAVREHECGIGMSFWFPAVWTMRGPSVVAGMLWNSTQTGIGSNDGVTTASSIDVVDDGFIDLTDDHRSSNLSDVKYSYNDTMLAEATKHYYLKFKKEKIKGARSFPGNYTYRDFEFRFFALSRGGGKANPVTIGSVMVSGDRLAADDSFSHGVVLDTKQNLLNVSYDIGYYAPADDWVRPTNGSYSFSYSPETRRRISAEGVYDPESGILCMVGCREHNGSTDCQTLVTVKFASLDARGQGHGRGVISSLRDKSDRLFFKKVDITLYGMYSDQVSEAISRMDLEGIMLVASTTLSCVFTVLQILRTKKNPEAAPAMSITMLAILTLGYLTPLVLNFDALFTSRRSREEPLVVRIAGEPATIWEDLVSYGGLILDGFLLPQIILNASLAGSGVRAISPWFYAGVTMTRVMPHVYDVVRRQIYEPSMSSSDLYASPRGDLFGVAWDIIIPCGAGVLAVLVFLQQRLGGSAVLPSQRRRSGGYEMVSSI